ncbi:hypothetical protein PAXRUDRAFT_824614 [Paxillus rubicundulus Ve08.2h10]|uniref:Uncharacterized protein n=1 Tax=Paxillus rubicundulus Ve08.2h10 TaxID=930991 RepID=A0A0D0DU63_9AGAM|nr:hypothetical protein PAXRUDRAFT_824614 [Paxillus rubicundulus Ve08.2h10]
MHDDSTKSYSAECSTLLSSYAAAIASTSTSTPPASIPVSMVECAGPSSLINYPRELAPTCI